MLSLRKFALVPAFALMAALMATSASASFDDPRVIQHGLSKDMASEYDAELNRAGGG